MVFTIELCLLPQELQYNVPFLLIVINFKDSYPMRSGIFRFSWHNSYIECMEDIPSKSSIRFWLGWSSRRDVMSYLTIHILLIPWLSCNNEGARACFLAMWWKLPSVKFWSFMILSPIVLNSYNVSSSYGVQLPALWFIHAIFGLFLCAMLLMVFFLHSMRI